MPTELTLLLLHAASTWAMVGLIWFVQVVHYPLMQGFDAATFPRWAAAHQTRTTFIVGPFMLVEAASALLLASSADLAPAARMLTWLGIAILALIWLSTFFVQVPLHAVLDKGFDRRAWQRLVATNWVRTIGWTIRGVLASLILAIETAN